MIFLITLICFRWSKGAVGGFRERGPGDGVKKGEGSVRPQAGFMGGVDTCRIFS